MPLASFALKTDVDPFRIFAKEPIIHVILPAFPRVNKSRFENNNPVFLFSNIQVFQPPRGEEKADPVYSVSVVIAVSITRL